MSPKVELIEQCISFLTEVTDRTAGADLERMLNRKYGGQSKEYRNFARLIKLGVSKGWLAHEEIDGPHYRRSRLIDPIEATHFFSITAVYMDSQASETDEDRALDQENVFRGQYHSHPYGEINLIVPIDDGAELSGPLGWQGPGWTAPPPGSQHYPEVRGGALIAFFFLPAGRISYDITPPNT